MFLFLCEKNMSCYEFYISDGQVNSIVWKQCGTYLTSTVIPQYVTHLHQKGMIQMNSIVWNLLRLKVSSTVIKHFFHSRIE